MTHLNKEKIIDYLSSKCNAYNRRLIKRKEAEDAIGVLDYEVRLKSITDFIIYLNKIKTVDRDKFINRIKQKKIEYKTRRDTYNERGLNVDATSCEISILPLDRLLAHVVRGDFDDELYKQGKDDSILEESHGSTSHSDGISEERNV